MFSVCSNFCFCWVLNNEETEIILFFSIVLHVFRDPLVLFDVFVIGSFLFLVLYIRFMVKLLFFDPQNPILQISLSLVG